MDRTFVNTISTHHLSARVDADRIATDPAYARTRENGEEFGRAGKLLRTAVRALLQKAGDSYVPSRLTAAFLKVIKADATSARGKRNETYPPETQLWREELACNT